MKTSAAGAAVIAAQEGLFVSSADKAPEAFKALRTDLSEAEAHVSALLGVEVTQGQFDALVALHRVRGIHVVESRSGKHVKCRITTRLNAERDDAVDVFDSPSMAGYAWIKSLFLGQPDLSAVITLKGRNGRGNELSEPLGAISAARLLALAGERRGFWAWLLDLFR